MTELLHPVPTASTPTAASAATGDAALPAQPATSLQAPLVRAARSERDSALLDEDLSPEDLAALSTRQLRVMVNQAYKLMDTAYPPAGATDRYEMIVDELEHRAQQAMERGSVHQPKETFRDNPLYSRFELFIDGTMAAYVKYTMVGAQIILRDGVEQPAFRDQGVDGTLMRHVVLNAHKRRLSLVPQCPMAFSFLADNPQYRSLTARTGH